jgi:peptidoglycan/xylan/chitin deacetylase (PgdA/CDA1 family)
MMKKVAYRIQGKPRVRPCPLPVAGRFPGNYRGAVVISADFEQAWAFTHSRSVKDPVNHALRADRNIPALLSLFDRHDIPITWATVGHLFLERCNRSDHDHLPRVGHFTTQNWDFSKGDWFDCDPGTDYCVDPAWYSPHLLKLIQQAKAAHEIGCHTFSHINCDEEICSPEAFTAELDECIKLAGISGHQLRSFIYPGNVFGHRQILAAKGFTCYRRENGFELSYPYPDQFGLINIPPSTILEESHLGWSPKYCAGLIEKALIKAVETDSVCHLWFHPTMEDNYLRNTLPLVCEHITRLRDQGKLWVATMGEMAEQARKAWIESGMKP